MAWVLMRSTNTETQPLKQKYFFFLRPYTSFFILLRKLLFYVQPKIEKFSLASLRYHYEMENRFIWLIIFCYLWINFASLFQTRKLFSCMRSERSWQIVYTTRATFDAKLDWNFKLSFAHGWMNSLFTFICCESDQSSLFGFDEEWDERFHINCETRRIKS